MFEEPLHYISILRHLPDPSCPVVVNLCTTAELVTSNISIPVLSSSKTAIYNFLRLTHPPSRTFSNRSVTRHCLSPIRVSSSSSFANGNESSISRTVDGTRGALRVSGPCSFRFSVDTQDLSERKIISLFLCSIKLLLVSRFVLLYWWDQRHSEESGHLCHRGEEPCREDRVYIWKGVCTRRVAQYSTCQVETVSGSANAYVIDLAQADRTLLC